MIRESKSMWPSQVNGVSSQNKDTSIMLCVILHCTQSTREPSPHVSHPIFDLFSESGAKNVKRTKLKTKMKMWLKMYGAVIYINILPSILSPVPPPIFLFLHPLNSLLLAVYGHYVYELFSYIFSEHILRLCSSCHVSHISPKNFNCVCLSPINSSLFLPSSCIFHT